MPSPIYACWLEAAAAVAIILFSAARVESAEVRLGGSGELVMEGKIEVGDYDRFRSALLGINNSSDLFLASPGGDLGEAIKIGRLVRRMKISTTIPTRPVREKIVARHGLKDPKNYTCASACFFVFVAGIYRSSDFIGEPILGIHKPYLSEADLRGLSSDQAVSSANGIKRAVEGYLKEMGIPGKYADQMHSIPRDEIHWISDEEFSANFEGFIPDGESGATRTPIPAKGGQQSGDCGQQVMAA
jgi:hypothetical protein